jgi:hypothetical protein
VAILAVDLRHSDFSSQESDRHVTHRLAKCRTDDVRIQQVPDIHRIRRTTMLRPTTRPLFQTAQGGAATASLWEAPPPDSQLGAKPRHTANGGRSADTA